MRIKNTTDKDINRLKDLLQFASRGVRDSGVEVHVKNGRGNNWGGVAYQGIPSISNVAKSSEYLVTIRIPEILPSNANESKYKLKRIERLYPEGIPFENWEDCFIWIASHEFRHIWQYQRRERTGKRGKGEYDSEKFAYQRLNDWRLQTGREEIKPVKQEIPQGFRK